MKNWHLVMAVAVMVTVAACDSSTKPAASSEAVTTPPTTSTSSTTTTTTSAAPAASSACGRLEGKVGEAGLCTVHTETPNYTIDMSFPVAYPDQDAVGQALTSQRDEFIALVEEPPVRDVPKALDIKSQTFRSGSPDAGTQSVAFEEYVNFGGAHPVTNYDALNYDLGKKAPITFETLFKQGSDPVAVLDPLVKDELAKALPGAPPIEDNPVGADMYKNFALTDDAVLFFLSQGQWVLSAAGPQTISIPRTELASILA